MIPQGDVYWLDLGAPTGSGPALRRPHVLVQNDVFNASRMATTVVCTISSRLQLGQAPGNVRLDEGEAGLPKQSVAVVTQLYTVDKNELIDRIGRLSDAKREEVLRGLKLLLESREPPG